MPRPLVNVLAAVFLVVAPSVTSQQATSFTYRQAIVDGKDGKPLLQLTNTSELPITAYVAVGSPYDGRGIAFRSYHDSCLFVRVDKPIASGQSTSESTGYYIDSQFKMVRTEVPAVIFEDGSTAGDSSWIDAVLARRLRFYDRLINVHDLLKQQIETGASLPGVVDKLQSAQASADKQLPQDDLRVMDDIVFTSAISSIQPSSGQNVDDLLRAYIKHLEDQASQLNRCQPIVEAIRTRLANRPNPEQPMVPPPFPN